MNHLKIGHLALLVFTAFTSLWAQQTTTYQTARDGRIFKVFQFPKKLMPHIDGQVKDWQVVPDSYRYDTKELKDTEDGQPSPIDTQDLRVRVTIGWVRGLDRIYFLYEAYDDFWDFGRFNPQGYLNDIFELVVDGDLSGGPFIFNPIYDRDEMPWNGKTDAYLDNHFQFSGVHAQNYHIYTPPVNNAWTLIWGSQPWIADFPFAHYAYDYHFQPGDHGELVLEGWITPFDHAPYSGPEQAIPSILFENKIIGLSWSILDFDGDVREGHINLSHDTRMVKDASYLCAFRLMPLEDNFQKELQADWTFEIINEEDRLVAFRDKSIGQVTSWHWDFGNGDSSTEQNPIYQFKEGGVHKVITLTVQGPNGDSKRTRYWEVMIR